MTPINFMILPPNPGSPQPELANPNSNHPPIHNTVISHHGFVTIPLSLLNRTIISQLEIEVSELTAESSSSSDREIAPTKSIEQDFKVYFSQLVSSCYPSNPSAVSELIELISEYHIIQIVNLDPEFAALVLNKTRVDRLSSVPRSKDPYALINTEMLKGYENLEMYEELVLSIHDLIFDRQPSKIIGFLSNLTMGLNVMRGTLEKKGLKSDIINNYMKELPFYIKLCASNRTDLFLNQIYSFSSTVKVPLPAIDRFRAAVGYCDNLYNDLGNYIEYIRNTHTMRIQRYYVAESKVDPKVKEALDQMPSFINHLLAENQGLTAQQKFDIKYIFERTEMDIDQKNNEFWANTLRVFDDIMINYSVVSCDETLNIFQIGEKNAQGYDLDYVHKHREKYDNFIPRVRELHRWIIESTRDLLEISLMSTYLPLYLKCGNLDQLKAQLDEKKIFHRGKFQKILFRELKLFVNEYNNDPIQFEKIKGILAQNNSLRLSFFYCYENGYERFLKLMKFSQVELGLPLARADECMANLFFRPPQKVTPSRAVETPKARTYKENAEKDFPEKGEGKTPEKEASSNQQLQEIKDKMIRHAERVKSECIGFGSQKALTNANIHLAGLLVTMKRLLDHKKVLNRKEFLFFILKIVEHGSLAAEQMLTALNIESNQLKTAGDLSEHLSHNLAYILFRCKFNKKDLGSKYREWIHDINGGTIYVRNLHQCSIQENSVQKLLAKANNFSQGQKSAFTGDEILQDLLKYFNKIGFLCIELQTFIEETRTPVSCKPLSKNAKRRQQKYAKGQGNASTQGLRESFLRLCLTVKKELSQLQITDEHQSNHDSEESETEKNLALLTSEQTPPFQPITAPIRKILDDIRLDPTLPLSIHEDLDTIQNNLLLQLEEEMRYHASLQPFHTYLHVSTILLLNQMIAEKYFYSLLNTKGIPYRFDEIDHDLVKLVSLLGMCEEDFDKEKEEWGFLSRGKETRLLARYPGTCDAAYKKKIAPALTPLVKFISDAIAVAQNADFEKPYALEDDYKLGNKNLEAKINGVKILIKKDIEILLSIMEKVDRANRRHL